MCSNKHHHTSSGPCHRCGRAGHLARECPLHICFRCYGRGHMAWECVEGITCSLCGELGHLQRYCKNVMCHRCGRKGHISRFCNDPFVKAKEAERQGQQQALSKSGVARSEEGQSTRLKGDQAVSTSSADRKDAPGPWDGLGDQDHKKMSSNCEPSVGIALESASKNGSRGTSFSKVRILSVKRKSSPDQAILEGAKSRAGKNLHRDKQLSGDFSESIPEAVSDDESPQWNGVLGYESEASGDSDPGKLSDAEN